MSTTERSETAFVHVYKLPEKLSEGYCFGGGVAIAFLNVDWFEAPVSIGREEIERFVRGKGYYDERSRFLLLADHPSFTFTIEPASRAGSPDEEERK
jgi:hypothetical protein